MLRISLKELVRLRWGFSCPVSLSVHLFWASKVDTEYHRIPLIQRNFELPRPRPVADIANGESQFFGIRRNGIQCARFTPYKPNAIGIEMDSTRASWFGNAIDTVFGKRHPLELVDGFPSRWYRKCITRRCIESIHGHSLISQFQCLQSDGNAIHRLSLIDVDALLQSALRLLDQYLGDDAEVLRCGPVSKPVINSGIDQVPTRLHLIPVCVPLVPVKSPGLFLIGCQY